MMNRKPINAMYPPSEAVTGDKKQPTADIEIPTVTNVFGSYRSANHPAGIAESKPPTNKAENIRPCSKLPQLNVP